MVKNEKMWEELAKYYDAQYSWKDYKKESESIKELIKNHKESKGGEFLDVACGTGNHIPYLKENYHITGVDLNSAMLKVAKNKFPKLKFHKGNMINFNLNKKFDIIACLFSSIAYVKTYNNLDKTIGNFAKHLKSGGVLLIEPFVHPRLYKPKKPASFLTVDNPELKLIRINDGRRKGDIAILDFHFLVSTKKGVEYIHDVHELGLFEPNKVKEIMKKHSFKKIKFLKNGLMKDRGLFIAVKK